MALVSVTVDLDEISCYTAIHGIDGLDGDAARAVYTRALPRIAAFLGDMDIRGTLFAVGRDLQAGDEAAALLKELGAQGHEMGNHTMNHRYDFATLRAGEQAREVD